MATASSAPREYALFAQAAPNGTADKETLKTIFAEYGSGTAPEGTADFAAVAPALKKEQTHHPEGEGNCLGFAALDSQGVLVPHLFTRKSLGPDDIRVQITHCGICHSDKHQTRNEWGNSKFPMVPGHEIVGIVTEVGENVTDFKVGERAGIGCIFDSCRECEQCKEDLEQHCAGVLWTYNSTNPDGSATQGGYSTHYVIDKRYALHVPDNLPLDAAAPLLCAGITVYSPLRYYGLDKPGMKVGVVGLGGLGHMAVKFLKAFGCEVTVISTSSSKREEALKHLGADRFVISKSEDEMKAAAGTLHGIIDTVSAQHDLALYMTLLRPANAKYVLVGVPEEPYQLHSSALIFKRASVGGTLVGGIKETQEMLDFCGEHNITCEIEKIPIDYVNTAMERLVKNDVHYRFVIDICGSLVYDYSK